MNYSMDKINPLLIQEVAATFLKYLTKDELMEARLVCSLWKSFAWTELTKRCLICFRTSVAMESYTEFFINHPTSLPPFTSYKLFFQFPKDAKILLTKFFIQFGSRIVKLDLQYSNVILTIEFQEFLTALKHLSISSSRIELSSDSESYLLKSLHSLEIFCENSNANISVVEELLRRQDYLKSLKLNVGECSDTFSERLVLSVSKILESLKCSQFEALDLNFPINGLTLYKLSQFKLSLTVIKVTIQNHNSSTTQGISTTEAMYEFLKSQKSSLINFKCLFCRWWDPEVQFGQLPEMNRLRKIYLENLGGNLQFLRSCSTLRKVKILRWRPDLMQPVQKTRVTMSLVESAVISLSGFPVVYNVLDYVTNFFSGLKYFEFNASITGDTEMYSRLIKVRLPQLKHESVKRLKLF